MDEAWDGPAWQAFSSELDAWLHEGRQATIWWRDDDAGRSDPTFERLLSLARDLKLPLGLAVVPAWLTPEVAKAITGQPTSVVVLQHGFSHTNYETAIQPGERKVRPAECGTARSLQAVLEELAQGNTRLKAIFGKRFLPVFVPPWNRVASSVVSSLPGLGYRGISVFGGRVRTEAAPSLTQINCHADPILWREGGRFAGARATLERLRSHLFDRRRGHADPDEPTGILTHHRSMDPTCWAFIEELLSRLLVHQAVSFPHLSSLWPAEWLG